MQDSISINPREILMISNTGEATGQVYFPCMDTNILPIQLICICPSSNMIKRRNPLFSTK